MNAVINLTEEDIKRLAALYSTFVHLDVPPDEDYTSPDPIAEAAYDLIHAFVVPIANELELAGRIMR